MSLEVVIGHPADEPRREKMLPNGNLAIAEVCTCGHLRDAYMPGIASWGHGPCDYYAKGARCRCSQFTWARFIEMAP